MPPPKPKSKQNKKNKKKNQQNKKKNNNHHNKKKGNNNHNNNNKNQNKKKNGKKKQNEEMKIDESFEIRGINLIELEKYKECGQTFPPSKPVKDLWEEKEYQVNQTMPHPFKGKMYVTIICDIA